MSLATDGFGTIIADLESGGGGGGGTVIPPGGNVTGTYEGNVLCDGNVTVSGHLEVKGSMIVRGDFINAGGFEVKVRGSLYARDILFDRTNKAIPQSNFEVDGNLIFTQMLYRQCGGVAALLRVGGDLVGASGFSGSTLTGEGESQGTSGLNILVYGNLTVAAVNINGHASNTTPGGNGGVCDVYGTASIWSSFSAQGGNGTGHPAGYGGVLDVYGDLSAGSAVIMLYGGDGTNASAGNAGMLDVGGHASVDTIEAYGGLCVSNSETHRSGNGGQVFVEGNLLVASGMNVNGGERQGTLTLAGTESSANGGYVNVRGDLVLGGDFSGHGGNVTTVGFAPHAGGQGAEVYVYGDLICSDDFRGYGGFSATGQAGNGGFLRVEGHLHVDDELEFYGGVVNGVNGLPAGSGGALEVYGNADVGYIDFSGGSSDTGNGGNGGTITIGGVLAVQDTLYANGGDCNSSNETKRAGQSGSILCYGILARGVVFNLNGGSRSGATPVAFFTPPTNGGSLTCYGPAVCSIISNGGSTTTDHPNAPGGNGGTITVYGTMTSDNSVTANGGQGCGNAGGNGGNLFFEGLARLSSCSVNGGASVDSVIGGDATTNGPAGTMTFQAGFTATSLSLLDGAGAGVAPVASSQLRLSGPCYAATVNMSDRADCWIYPNTTVPVTFRVGDLPTKKTINTNTGVPTADLVAAGYVNNGTFITGFSGGQWYVHTAFIL